MADSPEDLVALAAIQEGLYHEKNEKLRLERVKDLLPKCLALDPSKRTIVNAALQPNFFKEMVNPQQK